VFYGRAVQHSKLQKYVYAMVMAHFVKRELETLLYVSCFSLGGAASFGLLGPSVTVVLKAPLFPFSVHRFSHATMPLRNIFKKYAFNWLEMAP
jgi:very-long-chain enoyl-CoA reductase